MSLLTAIMNFLTQVIKNWDKVSQFLRPLLRPIQGSDPEQPGPSFPGVVLLDALKSPKRLTGEVFAAELLRKPVRIEKTGEGKTEIRIDRADVERIVISNQGKNLLCEQHVTPRQGVLREKDDEYHRFLLNRSASGSRTIEVRELPLRWASGGAVSIVKYEGRKWIPLFFRDIRPYGWNISLGSSERYFDENGNERNRLDDELDDPTRFISREFLEETLILKNAPKRGANTSCPVALPFWHGAAADEHLLQFSAEHLRLRHEYDDLHIRPDESERIGAIGSPTKMALNVTRSGSAGVPLTDVIICLNLLELGIEVVKVIYYELDKANYLLDGEVLDFNPKELTRMPVALISCEYLRSMFCDNGSLVYTSGAQPSVRVPEKPDQDHIHFFDWDIKKRLEIVRGEKRAVGTELDRYKNWYDKFRQNFFDESDMPSRANPSRLFTPATAKIISLCFQQVDPKIYEDES